MAESIASDLAVKLLEHLGQVAVEQIAPYFGGRSKLKKLQQKMEVIQTRLVDAESRREGERSALIKLWLKRLKSVLYELEDLFEQVSFADKEKEKDQRDHVQAFELIKLVRTLIFKCRRLQVNKNVSEQFKHIMMELEEIRSDMDDLNFRECAIDRQPLAFNLNSNRHTHSFIVEEDVIGREEDKKAIVEMLLNTNPSEENNVSIIPIIGIGGLGKTALAQLCFNDRNVQLQFELKAWACISEASSLEEIARVILQSITGCACDQLGIEEIQLRLRGAINDKKYLLVLDDVWDENRETWLQLRRLLSGGKPRSRIIVTSRSGVVAQNLGTVRAYELRGLPEDKSWALFKSLAFKDGQEERNPNFTSIGKEIVRKCANIPLAIRTIAGLLYCKDTEDEWVCFKDSELRRIDQHANGSNKIISTLKLSYDHLPSPLKQCFAYCSLFPKDHEIDKQQLIWLWMAQGYVRPWGNQSLEDMGHAYFMELLRRCFFQDVQVDIFGRILGCKLHDLMHDLASEVGDECLTVRGHVERIHGTIRHFSFDNVPGGSWISPSWLLAAKQVRSLVFVECCPPMQDLSDICSSLRRLRALDLSRYNNQSLPDSIGELMHLRYLKVSSNSLPDCISRLQNLEVLDLRGSRRLTELPTGLSEISSLRHLQFDISMIDDPFGVYRIQNYYCRPLDMPPRFGDLTSLRTLDIFVVGENNGLDALSSMALTGKLKIQFRKTRQNAVSEARLANLKGKKIESLEFDWSPLGDEEPASCTDEELESLQLPPSAKQLKVWMGKRNFPNWTLDNLVSIEIRNCYRCQQLVPFSGLPLLRFLKLKNLPALEYMEYWIDPSTKPSSIFYPSLEELELENLPDLKTWSRMNDIRSDQPFQSLSQLVFPCVSDLKIVHCPKLMSMPMAPRVRSMRAWQVQGELFHRLLMTGQEVAGTSQQSSSSTSSIACKIQSLAIGEIEGLKFLTINSQEVNMHIEKCRQLISVVVECPISLCNINIDGCNQLKEVTIGNPGELEFSTINSAPQVNMLIMSCRELISVTTKCPVSICNASIKSCNKLREVTIGNLDGLKLSANNPPSEINMLIANCRELTGLIVRCPISTYNANIHNCDKLKEVMIGALDGLKFSTINSPATVNMIIANCRESSSVTVKCLILTYCNACIQGCNKLKEVIVDILDGLEFSTIETPSDVNLLIENCRDLRTVTTKCPYSICNVLVNGCDKFEEVRRSYKTFTSLNQQA